MPACVHAASIDCARRLEGRRAQSSYALNALNDAFQFNALVGTTGNTTLDG